jgi:hypothetical protein
MKVNRFATAAVVAATAALALTACGPDETNGAAGAPTGAAATASSAPSTSAAPTAQPISSGGGTAKPTKPTKAPKPTPTKSSGGSPSSDCTAQAAANLGGAVVVQATDNGYATHIWMKAEPTKFVCGPDVPDDGYYAATSPTTEYRFATGAQAVLLGRGAAGIQEQTVPVSRLLQQINTCTGHPADATEFSCYGNMYDVTLDPSGKITTITQVYHP